MTTIATYPQRAPSRTESLMTIAPGVAGLQTVMVNLYYIGEPGNWVLVDAGVPMQGHRIIRAAEERFGRGARPNAIILTHGHFDHVGSLSALLEHWDVPVYAHRLEIPYLTGQSAYPPPDPTVGGGLWSRLSPIFPRRPYDFRSNIRVLPADGSVPEIEGWRWIHTPGHSPGHVSLFRDSDRTLIAGDAFITQKQESFFAVMTNSKQIHGPPWYFTSDWHASKDSVQRLAALEPNAAGTGHGLPMFGTDLQSKLTYLALRFDRIGMPHHGRYVNAPAFADEDGVQRLPPPVSDPLPKILFAAALLGAGALVVSSIQKNRKY